MTGGFIARERDEDAERNPETRGRVDKQREEKSEISRGYREARQELPDNPRDDPWGYTELPTRSPAENIVPPLWERIRSNALTVSQSSKQSNDPLAFLLAKALGKIQFFPHYWHPGVNENLTQNLDCEEATRVRELTYRLRDFDGVRRVKMMVIRGEGD